MYNKYFPREQFANTELFCQTRWTFIYKKTRVFYSNLEEIVKALNKFSVFSSGHVRPEAHQLHTTITSSVSIVSLAIIAKYSAMLEPICQMLQAPTIDLLKVKKHVAFLLNIFENHRENAEKTFRDIFIEVEHLAEKNGD